MTDRKSGTRIIFHVDVNSAFLSWSAVKRLEDDPDAVDLRTIPSVVGGDQATRHGIVTAKSIPAKKYGIETAEPVAKAMQKCPGLVVISSDWETYRRFSRAFIGILRRYTRLVEQASIDEAYMDVTELLDKVRSLEGSHSRNPGHTIRDGAVKLADRIRDEIRQELGFTVNVGISENRLLAKMASDFTKPDRTHTLFPDEVPEKMWPLPIGQLFGCGKKTADRLMRMGVHTIGDAAGTSPDILQSVLGEKGGLYLWKSANGKGSDRVITERGDAKSYSNETTTAFDITPENYEKEIGPLLEKLGNKVASRLQKDRVYAQTIAVTVKTSDFRKRSMQMRLPDPANSGRIICRTARELMDRLMLGDGVFRECTGIRLVGVKAADLDDGNYHQISFSELQEAEELRKNEDALKKKKEIEAKLTTMEEQLRQKFGENAVQKGWK